MQSSTSGCMRFSDGKNSLKCMILMSCPKSCTKSEESYNTPFWKLALFFILLEHLTHVKACNCCHTLVPCLRCVTKLNQQKLGLQRTTKSIVILLLVMAVLIEFAQHKIIHLIYTSAFAPDKGMVFS